MARRTALILLVLMVASVGQAVTLKYLSPTDYIGDSMTNINQNFSNLNAAANGAVTNLYDLHLVDSVPAPAVNNVLTWNGTAWSNKAIAGTGDFLADGTIPMTGPLDAGGQIITNIGAGGFSVSDQVLYTETDLASTRTNIVGASNVAASALSLASAALSTNGGTVNADVQVLNEGYNDASVATKGWTRDQLASGKALYQTTNMFAAAWLPTNTTGISSYENPVDEVWMSFAVTGVNHYVVTMVDTNPMPVTAPLFGPATAIMKLYSQSGSPAGNYSLAGKPEIYYTYTLAATDITLGDFSATAQSLVMGVTNALTYTMAWPNVYPTATYYRVFRWKCTAKGSATTNVVMGLGGTAASYVDMNDTDTASLGARGATNLPGTSYNEPTRSFSALNLPDATNAPAAWTASVITNVYDAVLLYQDAGATVTVSGAGNLYKIIATNSPTTICIAAEPKWSNRTATIRVNVYPSTNVMAFCTANLIATGNGSYTSVVWSTTLGTSLIYDHGGFTNAWNVYQIPWR